MARSQLSFHYQWKNVNVTGGATLLDLKTASPLDVLEIYQEDNEIKIERKRGALPWASANEIVIRGTHKSGLPIQITLSRVGGEWQHVGELDPGGIISQGTWMADEGP